MALVPTVATVIATNEEPGDPFHREFPVTLSTPGIEQELFSEAIPGSKLLRLRLVQIRCTMDGSFIVLKGSTIIGSGITGAASMNVDHWFAPDRPIEETEILRVRFTAHPDVAASDIKGFLSGRLLSV